MFPPKQKPPDLDVFGQPIKFDQKPPDLDDWGNPAIPEQPGFLSQVWTALNEPLTTIPSKVGKWISEKIDTPGDYSKGEMALNLLPMGTGNMIRALRGERAPAEMQGFLAGGTEGAGELASGLTSPLNIGATLATGGSNLALRAGLRPEVVKGISTAAKMVSAPAAAHGGMEMGGAVTDVFDPNIPLTETAKRFGQGAIEFAGGTLGTLHQPNVQGPILSRLWPKETPEAAIQPLLGKLRESLDKDAAKVQQQKPSPSQPETPDQSRTKVFIKTPAPELVNHIKAQGFDFIGVDPARGMIFERRRTPPPTPERVPEIEQFETIPEEESPDIHEFEDEPLFSKVPQSQEPQFAFIDETNFPEGPEPFFHLPDGSTVSQRELVRRGIEVPQLPDEQLGIGRQFPGVEAQEIGPIGRQPIDLNQALMEMESDMAKPVGRGFSEQVIGPQQLPEGPIMDPELAQRNLLARQQAEIEGPVTQQPTTIPRPTIEPPQLPHEFQPDIPMTKEPVEGGYSPRFGEQVLPEEEPLFSRIPKPEDEMRTNQNPRWVEAENDARLLDIDPAQFDNLDDLEWAITQKTAQETMRTGMNPLLAAKGEIPLQAKIGEGKAKIDVNVRKAADELTKGYNRPLTAVMVREGLQNSFDATKLMGKAGKTSIKVENDRIKISDNGKGMSPDELYTVYTNLHESGKVTEEGATGGKGVGKATFMLGGSHFSVETVKKIGNQKVRSSFSGTPEELLQGFDIQSEVVGPDTPTGTRIETVFKPDQDAFNARDMLNDIQKYSRNLDIDFETDAYGYGPVSNKFKKTNIDDRSIIKESVDNGNSNIEVLVPNDATMGEQTSVKMVYLNNGMYQFANRLYLDEATKGIPNEVIIDLKPNVPEGHDNYPFPVQRESVKESIQKEIENVVKDKLINPFASQKKMDLAKLWDSMPIMGKDPLTGVESVLFDPGNRLTPDELMEIRTNPVVSQLNSIFSRLVSDILATTERPKWAAKVKRVGITLDPTIYGVHIPDPRSMKTDPSSAILINPFAHTELPKVTPEGSMDVAPENAALDTVVTAMHEVAHVGSEDPKTVPPITDADLTDPRVGRYLQTYLQQAVTQGGLDMGHGMPFIHRLGEIYAKFGTRNGLNAATQIQQVLTGGQPGGYSPEVQRVLSIYSESRGRPAVTEDILSGTGVKSANTPTGAGNVPGDVTGLGGGTPRTAILRGKHATPDAVKAMKERGYEFSHMNEHGSFVFNKVGGGGKPPKQPILESEVPPHPKGKKPPEGEGINLWREAFEMPRALMSVDPPFMTSAMFRQGLPLVGTKGWFQAAFKQAKAFGSQKYFDTRMAELKQDPLFRPQGKKGVSWAERIGVEMTDMGSKLTKREEALRSKIAEKIPVYGRYIKASNRAFTLFLNELRATQLNELVSQGKADAIALENDALNPFKNEVLAKEIAEFINVATGRGKLKAQLPFTKLEYSMESAGAIKAMADIFFSPRLIASRLKMLNPSTYMYANPMVRKQYTKALLRSVGTWWGLASIGEMMFGAEVSKDPNNADFGKIKIGNTRLDPGGGFQQWLVLGSRMRPDAMKLPIESATGITPVDLMTNLMGHGGGKYTSSSSGESFPFGVGYKPETRNTVLLNWLTNKLHPTARFFWDLGAANEQVPVYAGDRLLQLFLPMMAGDLAELMMDDPTLIPLVLPFSGLGGGTQTYTGEPGKPSITPAIEKLFPFTEGLSEQDLVLGR